MSERVEIRVPDIGDFTDVEIVEVHVGAGDTVAAEDPLITLETDKAAMDIPAPRAGVVAQVLVNAGDRVSEGSSVLWLEPGGTGTQEPPADAVAPAIADSADRHAQVLCIGAGVGGYAAAFRAADLGRQVTLVERWPSLGGVCLNVGCIPSKALLHVARVIEEADSLKEHGVAFGTPDIDAGRLRTWKDSVVGKLTGGLAGMAKQRKVEVVQGTARFASPNTVRVEGPAGAETISFEQCVIAAGSEIASLPLLPDDPRILDSTSALELEMLPERMLVIGGGIIGLEMATVYDALGVAITVVELTDGLIPECDRDLVRPLQKHIEKRYEAILLGTSVTKVEPRDDGLLVHFEGANAPGPQVYGAILSAVGRRPNGATLNADEAGVHVDERGFIPVDKQMRTNVPHIFAVGDIVGQPMLAHKGSHQGHVAAEVICGHKRAFDARVIPSVAYTDPEVAWVGLTETEAKAKGLRYGKGVFPWAASGRAISMNRPEGLTKLLFDEDTERVIGMGAVGTHAGDLVAEGALAIEMGADAADLALTVHAHPTLSETIMMAAEVFEGTITDLYVRKKKT